MLTQAEVTGVFRSSRRPTLWCSWGSGGRAGRCVEHIRTRRAPEYLRVLRRAWHLAARGGGAGRGEPTTALALGRSAAHAASAQSVLGPAGPGWIPVTRGESAMFSLGGGSAGPDSFRLFGRSRTIHLLALRRHLRQLDRARSRAEGDSRSDTDKARQHRVDSEPHRSRGVH